MEMYSLVYIDDKPEAALTRFLDKEFHSAHYEINCSEVIFHPEEGYESLLYGGCERQHVGSGQCRRSPFDGIGPPSHRQGHLRDEFYGPGCADAAGREP